MLEFWRSLLRQSNPSTLTSAGLSPNFILTHPPPLHAEVDGDDKPEGDGIDSGEIGVNFSSPNLASWINGLPTLVGGDPQKNGGGDEAAWFAG
jgi:hypothetical protein